MAKKKKKKKGIYFKALISVIEVHGLFCVTLSYILAWIERTNVVENLSMTIVSEIIAPLIIYGITKTVENIFEKNQLSFSTPIASVDKTTEENKGGAFG